jgi:mono/diheme cytochrome c family protein
MKSTYVKIVLFVLIVGLVSACGAQPATTPASSPTDQVQPATEAPTEAPTQAPASTDTAAPTEPAVATEAPATQPAAGGATVSFANDVMPIFQSRCIGCHGGDRTEEGLDLKAHESLMAGSDNGPVVVPGDAVNSLLVELVATQKMPKRGPKLTPPQVQIITDWVNQGASDN